jgi:hypothetical protein
VFSNAQSLILVFFNAQSSFVVFSKWPFIILSVLQCPVTICSVTQ